MNYADIKQYDIANGPGVRVSLFVSGCTHRCKNCFNKEAWDFSYGAPFTEETQELLLSYLAKPYVKGLTLLGGEPFERENQKALVSFLRSVKERFPEKDIWAFSGYDFEKAVETARAHASAGGNVLLSPACASFDMFKDYEERGREFKRIVNALKEKES